MVRWKEGRSEHAGEGRGERGWAGAGQTPGVRAWHGGQGQSRWAHARDG